MEKEAKQSQEQKDSDAVCLNELRRCKKPFVKDGRKHLLKMRLAAAGDKKVSIRITWNALVSLQCIYSNTFTLHSFDLRRQTTSYAFLHVLVFPFFPAKNYSASAPNVMTEKVFEFFFN